MTVTTVKKFHLAYKISDFTNKCQYATKSLKKHENSRNFSKSGKYCLSVLSISFLA